MISKSNRILVVEDDPDDLLLLKRALSKCEIDHSMDVVTDGERAVSYLNAYVEKSIDPRLALILMDLKLPRKSGLEVLDWIRKQTILKRVPVVMLTSSRNARDITNAYDLGANSYLVKPVGAEILFANVKILASYWLNLNVMQEAD